jgi:hypothetical protein
MKITPKTEEEIIQMNLKPDGEYPFVILEGQDAVSKNGNEMIKLKLSCYLPNGKFFIVWDYLLESFPKKLKHACSACGLSDKYNSGVLSADDFIGREGFCMIGSRKSEGFDQQNVVSDYVVKNVSETKKEQKSDGKATDDMEDFIPF